MQLTIHPITGPLKCQHLVMLGECEGVLFHEDPLKDWIQDSAHSEQILDTLKKKQPVEFTVVPTGEVTSQEKRDG